MSTVWIDLTTSLAWKGGVVGIVRAELELASKLQRLQPGVRFCRFEAGHFFEVTRGEVAWLVETDDFVDAFLDRNRQVVTTPRARTLPEELASFPQGKSDRARIAVILGLSCLPRSVAEPALEKLLAWYAPRRAGKATAGPDLSVFGDRVGHMPTAPFQPGDVVLNAGWMDNGKEATLAHLKAITPGLKLVCAVYDTITINDETRMLYPSDTSTRFGAYFDWISRNADLVICGGENTKSDVRKQQQKRSLRQTRTHAVKWGSQTTATDSAGALDDDSVLRLLRVSQPFILCVGTIEARKNHQILYKAYKRLRREDAPLMVFAGTPDTGVKDFLDTLRRDPEVAGRFMILRPRDRELAVLYRRALFTVLPSLYEGWSLTLPESLQNGKFCIAADVPPLREVGGDHAEYVDPFDARGWADRIAHYARDKKALRAREDAIRTGYHAVTWTETAEAVHTAVARLSQGAAT